MSWLQRQTRPDLSLASSSGQTAMSDPRVFDLMECNKAIAQAKDKAEMEVTFLGGKLNWDLAEVMLTTDASHANVRDVVVRPGVNEDDKVVLEAFRSQKGMVVCLRNPTKDGETGATTCVMEWKSQVERRVCRSTLAAETYALATGTEHADWLKALLEESRNPKFSVLDWEDQTRDVVAQWLVDAKSVQEHLSRDVGAPGDKRLAIEMMALRQLLHRAEAGKGDRVVWIDTTVQLADCLTKSMEPDFLLEMMEKNFYDTEATADAKAAKSRKAMLRRARKAGGEDPATRDDDHVESKPSKDMKSAANGKRHLATEKRDGKGRKAHGL